jgi:hypothetical protein
MNLVREYMPNGIPFLIQGKITDSGDTYSMDVRTVHVYPISHDGVVLPELVDGYFNDDFMTACAIRLTRMFTEKK